MAKIIKSIAELDIAALSSYTLLHHEYLSDIDSMGLVFLHNKSGARVCVISGDDEDKLFCAAFRTPPESSTGVPHIIEHTVLCGSKNFPSRDPFMQLVKGSLNTFINAMTYPDKTVYPVSSCNAKDFDNLMHVYLDAVFYPNIYKHKEIFMQEGWHYEIESPEDELKINGIVYSEMKGALSNPSDLIYEELQQAMFPDNTYGVNSGGDPKVIPTLTYEEYLDFHRRYYHPANSYIFLYGDMDVEEKLCFMDEQYLSRFDRAEIDSHIEPQKPFGGLRRLSKPYSVSADDDGEGKYYYGYGVACGDITDAEQALAWEVLSDVLLYSPGAPVKQALLDAGIGRDISGGYSDHMLQPVFEVIAKNADGGREEDFCRVICEALCRQVEQGISKKSLLAAVNIREFRYREADFEGTPKGLVYALDILQNWLYGDEDIFARMKGGALYASLKKKIDTDYYEGLIKQYLLSEDHAALLTLVPTPGLLEEQNEALRASLAEKKAAMSEEDLAAAVADTAALIAYQSAEPTEEELNCIPSLMREDIPRRAPEYCNEERRMGDIPVLYHDLNTNGISYIKLLFPLPEIPADDLPYLGILGRVLGRIDTKHHRFQDLSDEIKIHTGGIGFELATYPVYGKADETKAFYEVTLHAIGDEVVYGFSLMEEIITDSIFGDTKRLKEILGQIVSAKQSRLQSSGHAAAIDRARSYYSKRGHFKDQLSGITAYQRLKTVLAEFDSEKDTLVLALQKLTAAIFRKDGMWVDVAADADGYRALERSLAPFTAALDKMEHPDLGTVAEPELKRKNEGFMLPVSVQYVGRCGNLIDAGYRYSGVLHVLAGALNCEYLYNAIRVRGGAYGCGCGFSSDTGDVIFYSYRDPNCKATDRVYRSVADYVRSWQVDEGELTKYVIGAFSDFERPLSPAQKAARSLYAYISGKTYADLQREREEMLQVTAEEFKAAAEIFDAVIGQNYICTIGSEEKLREDSEMFGTLLTLN